MKSMFPPTPLLHTPTIVLFLSFLSSTVLGEVTQSTVEDSKSQLVSPKDLTSPLLFLRHLEEQDVTTENIRHQRQIKFKSSYSELPEVLQKAEDRQNKGKSLVSKGIKVIPDDIISRESTALKDLPPSSDVYFKPNMEDHVSNSLIRYFGRSISGQTSKIHKRTKHFSSPSKATVRKPVNSALQKSISQTVPHPEKVNFKFQGNRFARNRNKISKEIKRGSKRFLFPKVKNNSNQSGPFASPNAIDEFRNPLYVETSSREISSYSSVPDESFVDFKPKPTTLKALAVTPVPKRVHQTKSIEVNKPQPKTTSSHFVSIQHGDSTRGRRLKHQQRNKLSKTNSKHQSLSKSNNSKHQSLSKSNISKHQSLSKSKPSASPKRAKSLNQNSKRFGFSDLLTIPETGFSCGEIESGEYIADKAANCQVFHVCYGGRKASFLCPTGTAFSQDLLVCDWWHKVKCSR